MTTTKAKKSVKPFSFTRQKTEKIVNINTDKYIKPKKNTGQMILRVILWIVLAFVAVRGIVSVIKPDPLLAMQQRTNSFIAEQQAQRSLDFEMESFAQNFAQEFLTYEAGKLRDYTQRISPYISNQFTLTQTQNFKNTATASYIQAYKIEPYSDDNKTQFDVYVMATVDYILAQPVADGVATTTKTERENTYLKIPVRVLGIGKYIVEDYPVFVAAPTGNSYTPVEFIGREVDKNTNTEIERMLSNFLAAYYQENQTRIDYFLAPEADKQAFKGLNGRYKFSKISSLRCFGDPHTANRVLSLVELILEDKNGQHIAQRFNVLLKVDGDKFYVIELDTKTVDIKHNFAVE